MLDTDVCPFCEEGNVSMSNLNQIQAGPLRTVNVQIGYATFRLRWRDIDALQSRLAKQGKSRDIVIGRCHFRLSPEGRQLLQAVLEQAIHAAKACEEQQRKQTEEGDVAEKWLRCLRFQD